MLYEVQTATNKNLCLTCLVPQSGKKKQKQKPRRQHLSVQALRIFCFMELRPQVFSLCKHFAILFSWNSGRAQCFQPVRALHSLIFTNPRHMFSATASDFYLHVSPVPTTWDFISFHRFIYRDSSPSYTAHFRKPALNQRPLWMKSCELKFLLTSCWILWKKMLLDENRWPQPFTNPQVENPTLDETLSLTFGKALPPKKSKKKQKTSYWLNTGACFSTKKWNPLVNVFGVMAKAICGPKPGAPALGFSFCAPTSIF